MRNKLFLPLFIFALVLAISGGIMAQDEMTPSVTVADQISVNGDVTVAEVVSNGSGWIVIHTDNEGAPGPVAGYAHVSDGTNTDVVVDLDESMVTPVLYAMLHTDTGEEGEYEFGMVEDADGPVIVDGAPVTPAFSVEMVVMPDQFLVDGTLTASTVVTAQNGWLVIHAGTEEGPGEVIGYAPVFAGNNSGVVVTLDGESTNTVYPMMHVDTGEAEVYEFGMVEGADGPVTVNDAVVVFPISTVPTIEYSGTLNGATLTIASALIDVDGWMVIHADNEGAPGAVIGYTALPAGYNSNIVVELDTADVETVFPMLHVDTGEEGVYEFGMVEGADTPVFVGEAPVVGPLTPTVVDSMDMMDDDMGDDMDEDMGDDMGESMDESMGTEVSIENFSFGDEITVTVGTTVTWTNNDSAPHTVTADDGSFASGTLNGGDTFSFTFEEAGSFAYYCEFHGGADGSGMSSVVNVVSE